MGRKSKLKKRRKAINNSFVKSQYQSYGLTKEKMSSHVFGIKLPVKIEAEYLRIEAKERLPLIRKLLIEAVNNHEREFCPSKLVTYEENVKKESINEKSISSQYQSYDGIKNLGKHQFSFRLPLEVAKLYLKMTPKDRVTLIRKTLVDYIKEQERIKKCKARNIARMKRALKELKYG